ncbi:MAG: hypothetical protein PF440_04885 [Thiomicrorhabdus sp.]|jgi:Mg2+ and Co2+ transporter CorA|nr:hypothetical protein [Thiomicrorhabdus sp.]
MEIIIGVITGAAIPLLKDWLSARRTEKLERIKLHDTQKIKAYQIAYKFSSTLRMSLKDKSQAKDLAFLNNCASELYTVIENLPYYSKRVRSSLIELESVMENVMNNIMEKDANSDLINEKVNPISDRLRNEILCDFKVWE